MCAFYPSATVYIVDSAKYIFEISSLSRCSEVPDNVLKIEVVKRHSCKYLSVNIHMECCLI